MIKGLEALEKITNYKCSRMSEKIACKEIIKKELKELEELQQVLDDFGIYNIMNLIDTLKNIQFLEKRDNEVFDNLLEINRNKDGNYYFIYSVPNVRNTINTKAKPRDEIIIVGINQKFLVKYLNNCVKGRHYETLQEE